MSVLRVPLFAFAYLHLRPLAASSVVASAGAPAEEHQPSRGWRWAVVHRWYL